MQEHLVDISRLQFAATALYHFLFVPLTLGMVWILLIMETVYVMTGKQIYKDMTKFWGKLFGINFALGVTTGITMEFQFGTNWAYYSHYVGDIFGAPLAIEGLMAFFLESTFIGLFFFGWDRLSKPQHLLVTLLTAVGTNLSALWILVANGWMQNPIGSDFSFTTMRMEMTSFWDVVFNPIAQAKFVHTVSGGYVAGSMFVLAISSYYILSNKHIEFAKRSFRIAAAFGLAAALSAVVLGDESGYTIGEAQQTKLAAMEAMWKTEPAPAPLTLVAGIDEKQMKNDWEIKIPYLLGVIGTRSLDKQVPGIIDIKEHNRQRIIAGIEAAKMLDQLRKTPNDTALATKFEAAKQDLGYGLLVRKYVSNYDQATPEVIQKAVDDTVPHVAPMFWGFRIMVGLGFYFILLFGYSFYCTIKGNYYKHKNLLRLAMVSFPLPWFAIEIGWFVAEYGRQPWTIFGILPTNLSVSAFSVANVYGSLAGFIGFYTILLIVEVYLMVKFAKAGPQTYADQH